MKVTSIFAFILLGFAATIGQILVLRELLTVFSGTELAVAIVLAAWLFWTALGGLLGGKLSQYYRDSPRLFGYLQGVSGLILASTIFLDQGGAHSLSGRRWGVSHLGADAGNFFPHSRPLLPYLRCAIQSGLLSLGCSNTSLDEVARSGLLS